jgi:hypothetical protein
MKRSSPRRIEKDTIANGVNVSSIAGNAIHGAGHNGPATNHQIRRGRGSNRANEYPVGSIGCDLEQRNYIQYLVQRYHRARAAELSFGRRGPARSSYAIIFTNIERKFGAPTYFVPQARFDELVKYLQQRIDATILGKNNRARKIRNYASPDEFAAEQAAR